MKLWGNVAAVVAIVVGAVWILQGVNILGGSFMSGQPLWLYIGIAVAIAGLFCFLPGLILQGLFMFTLPLIVDGGLTATTAMRQSWNALKGQWLTAALFHVVISFVSSIGIIFCCVGILFTGPIYVLSLTVLYRDFFLAKGTSFQGKPVPPYADF